MKTFPKADYIIALIEEKPYDKELTKDSKIEDLAMVVVSKGSKKEVSSLKMKLCLMNRKTLELVPVAKKMFDIKAEECINILIFNGKESEVFLKN